MLLLVTDTSRTNGSVALARDTAEGGVRVIESVPLEGGTFSAQLVSQISGLLAKHGLGKSDIDAFVVVSGPGSFTGLRVGLAAIKALAEILGKPIVPVSLLEVIALASGKQGKVMALIDAGRGDVYTGKYEVAGTDAVLIREELKPKAKLSEFAEGFAISTASAQIAAVVGSAALVAESNSSAMIAHLGWRKLQSGATVSPEHLDANYGRASDADIFAKSNS